MPIKKITIYLNNFTQHIGFPTAVSSKKLFLTFAISRVFNHLRFMKDITRSRLAAI